MPAYRNRDLDNLFRAELVSEARRVLTYPHASQIVQKISKDYEVSIAVGFGDMFDRLKDGGFGHIRQYHDFRRRLGKMRKGIPQETYQKRTEEIRSLFSRRAHRDYDLGFSFHDGSIEDKEALTNKLSSSLNQSLREAVQQQLFLKGVMDENSPFNGFHLYSSCVLSEKEFVDFLERQIDIASAFPYNLKASVTANNSPITFKEVEAGTLPEGVRIFTKPQVPITVTSVQTSLVEEGKRKAIITIEPSKRLSEPFLDVLERGRGAVIYYGKVGEELEDRLKKHQALTGLPRSLESQNKIYQEYISSLLSLGLDKELEISAKNSLEVLKSLSPSTPITLTYRDKVSLV